MILILPDRSDRRRIDDVINVESSELRLPTFTLEYRANGIEINRIFTLKVHSSTIRRWLPRLGIVWLRAASTLHIRDPDKQAKLAKIKEALERCDIDNPVFYEDEVDIHLNPKMGADWMVKVAKRKSLLLDRMQSITLVERCTQRPVKCHTLAAQERTQTYLSPCFNS